MSSSEEEAATSSEATMLEKRLEEELTTMVKDMIGGSHNKDINNGHTNGEQFSDMEAKAYEALFQAAKEICYKRKYYDASKDEIIYFPTLAKTILDRSLLDKADDWFARANGGDEEFPREYSMRLRKLAFSVNGDNGHHDDDSEQEEFDQKVMMRLSEPVVDAAVTTTAASKKMTSTNTEQTLVWKRGNEEMNGDISFPVEEDDAFDENGNSSIPPAKNHNISEDQIQRNLGLRRQASFLRKASIMDSLEKYYEPEPMKKSTAKKVATKESEMRQTRIIKELKEMIEKMLLQSNNNNNKDLEGETDMEPAAQQALVKAAKDICYTRKHLKGDQMIYFPSLGKSIIDKSLFEKAEEYYKTENNEKFPEKYAMGLKKVAMAQKEEEGHDDTGPAEEEEMEYAMMMQLSQPVGATTDSPIKKSKKLLTQPMVLKDKRMDTAEETMVWTRASRETDPETSVEVAMEAEASMAAALASVPSHPPLPKTVKKPAAEVVGVKKHGAATEEDVQQRLGVRRQASFLRKAAVLDSIGKHEGEENLLLPPIGESSSDTGNKKKHAKSWPSKLLDKRMNTSEEAYVWTRSDRNLGSSKPQSGGGFWSLEASVVAEMQRLPTKTEEKFGLRRMVALKNQPAAVTEEKVQHRLGLRRQASCLRKAAVLDSMGKHEGEETNLPPIADSSDSGKKKAKSQSSRLVDTRMNTSEEAFVWARSDRNIASDPNIPFEATTVEEKQRLPTKTEAKAKPASVTEEGVQQRLGLRKQQSFLRKAAVLDSIGKHEGEETNLPTIGESADSGKKKAKSHPSNLVDKRMDASEEAYVWTRTDQNLGAHTSIAFDATAVPEQKSVPTTKKEAPAVSEEDVRHKLGLRKQQSFLRKAAVLDSIGKNEGEETNLPTIGESADSGKKKAKSKPSNLVDKRMDASEEAYVWTRTDQNLGANTSIAFDAPTVPEQKSLPTKKEAAAVSEEDVQQRLGLRKQQSFLRKAAVLDSIGKNEGEETNLPTIGESADSGKKKAKSQPSKLVDKRMDASEEAYVWTRTDQNLGANTSIAFDATAVPEQSKSVPTTKKEAPSVTEEDVQQRLGLRKQQSFLRKAAVLDSIGKNEGEETNLPAIGESGDSANNKKKNTKGRPSKLVDKRMDASEEAYVWTRTDQNLGANTSIAFDATAVPEQSKPVPTTKKEAPAVAEEDVQQKLGLRREASFLRKAAVLDSLGKQQDGEENLPPIGESSNNSTGKEEKKKMEARPSTLLDKRMDASEESFVWTRSTRSLDADASNRSEQPQTLPAMKE